MSWRLSGLFLALAGFSAIGVCRVELDSCTSCWSNSSDVTGAFTEPDVNYPAMNCRASLTDWGRVSVCSCKRGQRWGGRWYIGGEGTKI